MTSPEKLEPKEGVVLDREGNTVFEPGAGPQADPFGGAGPSVRVIRFGGFGWLAVALLAIGLPILFVAGVTFFAAFIAAIVLFRVLRALLRLLR